MSNTAILKPVQMEVARMRKGRPGYVWVEAYEVTTPHGQTLVPYMRKREALKWCRANGWHVRVKP